MKTLSPALKYIFSMLPISPDELSLLQDAQGSELEKISPNKTFVESFGPDISNSYDLISRATGIHHFIQIYKIDERGATLWFSSDDNFTKQPKNIPTDCVLVEVQGRSYGLKNKIFDTISTYLVN